MKNSPDSRRFLCLDPLRDFVLEGGGWLDHVLLEGLSGEGVRGVVQQVPDDGLPVENVARGEFHRVAHQRLHQWVHEVVRGVSVRLFLGSPGIEQLPCLFSNMPARIIAWMARVIGQRLDTCILLKLFIKKPNGVYLS